MKQIFILIISILLISCNDDDTSESTSTVSLIPLGTTITSLANETVQVASDSGRSVFSIPVRVIAIEDSRCPIDAICVSEGEAKVTFRVSNLQFVMLVGTSGIFEFGAISYKITLNDVTPYPTTTNQNEPKKAVYVIEKRV